MSTNFSDTDKNNDSLLEKNFEIAIYDLDMNFSSTMPIICNYFYDVGMELGHIAFRDTEIMKGDVVFVLRKFRVRIDKYPSLRENVIVRSWISPIEHNHAVRNYLLTDESGNVCAKAIYLTTAFNLKERVRADISGNTSKAAKTLDLEPPLPHVFEDLPDVVSPDYENAINVRYFDCDFYGHVTSVKYIEWGIESMPVEFLRKHKLYEMEINFKRESSPGDRLIIKTAASSEKNIFIHSITSEDGSKDIVRMKSIWT
ncbi:MAG: thioesterase [Leptospirales bacterium]|nr:thioesterase [Leptospirales bacterium]